MGFVLCSLLNFFRNIDDVFYMGSSSVLFYFSALLQNNQLEKQCRYCTQIMGIVADSSTTLVLTTFYFLSAAV